MSDSLFTGSTSSGATDFTRFACGFKPDGTAVNPGARCPRGEGDAGEGEPGVRGPGDPSTSIPSSLRRFLKSTVGVFGAGVAGLAPTPGPPPNIHAFRFLPILRVNSCVICCADRCSSSLFALACCAAFDNVGGFVVCFFFPAAVLPGATRGSEGVAAAGVAGAAGPGVAGAAPGVGGTATGATAALGSVGGASFSSFHFASSSNRAPLTSLRHS